MALAPLILALALTTGADPSRDPVLLDFGATWCGPCQSVKPEVARLKQQGLPVREIDIDQKPELARRFKVGSVPTFIVVDADGKELDRLTGARTADQLADFYDRALDRAGVDPEASEESPDDERSTGRAVLASSRDEDPTERKPAPRSASRHHPWESVVRIKVINHTSRPRATIGFGSGTIIYSDDQESIILTCAHIFKMDNVKKYPHPSKYPLKVMVDLFDGRLSGGRTPHVTTAEVDIPAEVIDYDFAGDVGLIRIRPGKRLPYSKVVPPNWTPKEGMPMTTVGCSQGRDATAWSTEVTRPSIALQTESGHYEATECAHAPIQGRSGGGLFTLDGVLAGVCDFNDGPNGRHGLYASPRTIHRLLNRHGLEICYAIPPGREPSGADRGLMADNNSRRTGAGRGGREKVAMLEADPSERITIPPPEMLGSTLPEDRGTTRSPRGQARTRGVATSSHPRDDDADLGFLLDDAEAQKPQEANHSQDPLASGDLFSAAPDDVTEEPAAPAPRRVPADPATTTRAWQSRSGG